MKISGCIITKNEEDNIAQCIGNLKGITDEIIVMDTGSDDNTVKIAKQLGALVYEHKWENDFSKARNTALQYASGDWIIFLDADEYFSDDSLPNIRQVIHQVHPRGAIEAISCDMVNIDKDSGRVFGNNLTMRIFRNCREFAYINKIHEEIRHNGAELKCANKRGDLTIIHTGYSSSLIESKARRNLELLLDNPKNHKRSQTTV